MPVKNTQPTKTGAPTTPRRGAPAKVSPSGAGAGGAESVHSYTNGTSSNGTAHPDRGAAKPGAKPAQDPGELVRKAKGALRRSGEYAWEAADAFVALAERGWTQQRIARECGVPQSKVSKFIACVRDYSAPNNDRHPFWKVYKEVDGHKKGGARKRGRSAEEAPADVTRPVYVKATGVGTFNELVARVAAKLGVEGDPVSPTHFSDTAHAALEHCDRCGKGVARAE